MIEDQVKGLRANDVIARLPMAKPEDISSMTIATIDRVNPIVNIGWEVGTNLAYKDGRSYSTTYIELEERPNDPILIEPTPLPPDPDFDAISLLRLTKRFYEITYTSLPDYYKWMKDVHEYIQHIYYYNKVSSESDYHIPLGIDYPLELVIDLGNALGISIESPLAFMIEDEDIERFSITISPYTSNTLKIIIPRGLLIIDPIGSIPTPTPILGPMKIKYYGQQEVKREYIPIGDIEIEEDILVHPRELDLYDRLVPPGKAHLRAIFWNTQSPTGINISRSFGPPSIRVNETTN